MAAVPCHSCVLLVNDSSGEREMYAEWFRRAGFRTLQASNARDGFRMAAELKPDVVVTDFRLPGLINGLALTSCLKRTSSTRDAAIVMLTMTASTSERELAKRAGCDRFLTKPCTPQDLAHTVDELLGPDRAGRA